MTERPSPVALEVRAVSNADALGYLGQHAVSRAMGESSDYLLIGGQMVRLLLHAYPTPKARHRSTVDADSAVGGVELIGQVSQLLQSDGFRKVSGNAFLKDLADERQVEINVLMPRTDSTQGIRPRHVEGVGNVDTLPELDFALNSSPITMDVAAHLMDGSVLTYRILVPSLETGTILKAHSWQSRRAENDLADLSTLLEIREEHPELPWHLAEPSLRGRRLDTARFLHELAAQITRKSFSRSVPQDLDRYRFSALITKHVTTP
jgi:hypothetical protein